MKLQKILVVLILLLMSFSSMAFAVAKGSGVPINQAQGGGNGTDGNQGNGNGNLETNSINIAELLQNSALTIQEAVDMALLGGATLADIYAAAESVTDDGGALVSQITAAAFVAATTKVDSDGNTITPPFTVTDVITAADDADVPMTTVVEQAVTSGVSLTVVMISAPSDLKGSIEKAAVLLTKPVVAADGTETAPVLSIDDVAVAMLATGTADLSESLEKAGATDEQIDTVNVDVAAEQSVIESNAAEDFLNPEPPEPECDTSVSPYDVTGCP